MAPSCISEGDVFVKLLRRSHLKSGSKQGPDEGGRERERDLLQ